MKLKVLLVGFVWMLCHLVEIRPYGGRLRNAFAVTNDRRIMNQIAEAFNTAQGTRESRAQLGVSNISRGRAEMGRERFMSEVH